MALNELIEQRHHPRELVDWLEESVNKNDDENASVVTLDSLVKQGIFRKEKLSVGTRFYLNNQGKLIFSAQKVIINLVLEVIESNKIGSRPNYTFCIFFINSLIFLELLSLFCI